MSDVMPESVEIESLLADRQRLQDWIARLDSAAGSAPEPVRQRVRGDYEGRLAEVVARLRGFTTALSASLQTVRSQRDHLDGLKAEAEEAEAEAMLRHDVGEFSDEQWETLARDCRGKIEGLSGDIARLSGEAGRLEEVLGQVMPPEPAPAPRARREGPPRRAPGDDIDVEVIEQDDLTLVSHAPPAGDDDAVVVYDDDALRGSRERAAPVEAPRFTPKPGAEARSRERGVRTLRFPAATGDTAAAPSVDEMTFLKSVTLDSQAGERTAGEGMGAGKAPRAGGTGTKTLKCTECGAMNRPTEWYCERCGAELAAL